MLWCPPSLHCPRSLFTLSPFLFRLVCGGGVLSVIAQWWCVVLLSWWCVRRVGCGGCYEWRWWVLLRWGIVSCSAFVFCFLLSALFRLCVCYHSIVGLGVCVCGRVVSLRNGGDGLRWGGRAVCEGGVISSPVFSSSSSSSSSFLSLLVFGVVRAQLCEHARYPRTPLRLPCCLVFLFVLLLAFFAPRLSSVIEWRWCVFTMYHCAVLA